MTTTATEQQIRGAHTWGGRCQDLYSVEPPPELSGVLRAAWLAGWLGLRLGAAVLCERYGKIPTSARSRNAATGCIEPGVSVIRAGEDTVGSCGADLWMRGRPLVQFRGILIEGRRGSDGEPLVLPVS
jgi:hypothetical protein